MTDFIIAPSFIKGYSYCESNAISTKFPETIIISTNDPRAMAVAKIKPEGEGPHKGYYVDTQGHNHDNAGYILGYMEGIEPPIDLETVFL